MLTTRLFFVVCIAVLALSPIAAHGFETEIHAGIDPPGLEDWVFSNAFEVDDEIPAGIWIYPNSWLDAWIGARQQFSAVVTNANGRPLAGQAVTWSSTWSTGLGIDQAGLATALKAGDPEYVMANAGALTESAEVRVAFDGSSGPGLMYTMWFARGDSAPAILVDGQLELPKFIPIYGADANPTNPWPANGRDGANNRINEVRPTIAKFQWEGNRIGLLTDVANGAGTFRVRDRIGEWSNLVIGAAVDFQLENNHIAVLLDDGRLLHKQGIYGTWGEYAAAGSGLRSFLFEDTAVGLLYDSGYFLVADELEGGAVVANEGSTIDSFKLDVRTGFGSPRAVYVGALTDDGGFMVKRVSSVLINEPWVVLASSGVADFQLEDPYSSEMDEIRIGMLYDDGRLLVGEGTNGPFTLLAAAGTGVVSFELHNNWIGELYGNGLMRVKEGIHGPWTTLAAAGDGAVSFRFQNNPLSFQTQDDLIGVLFGDGTLQVQAGINGVPVSTPAFGPDVSQYQLMVDVPSPPARTTLASYNQQQSLCHDQGHPLCYQDLEPDVPVDWYGRFCGGGHPGNWGWAVGQGPIDSFDEACMHHDLAVSWYPEGGSGDNWVSCIVRYALVYGRLTYDGILLTHGGESQAEWDAGWGSSMPNMKAALDQYFSYVYWTCSDDDLTDFINDTD